MKSRWLRLGAVLGVLVGAVGFGVRPAYAAPGEISTVAGGPGSGPAMKVRQSAVALASSGSQLWTVDGRCCGSLLVRRIDTTTGLETVPLLERNDGGWAPSIAADGSGNIFLGSS